MCSRLVCDDGAWERRDGEYIWRRTEKMLVDEPPYWVLKLDGTQSRIQKAYLINWGPRSLCEARDKKVNRRMPAEYSSFDRLRIRITKNIHLPPKSASPSMPICCLMQRY